ncbi:GntR family transcriptional regulator [Microbispora sp. H10836]|uniref:GntR family transcriptional regulator n=1 Tax=Microbispora sp. H10836 TaxID=2729106 RepID=UPI001474EF16|nr:GntR family transcriptional regulator [Microbispora sp. H10836]
MNTTPDTSLLRPLYQRVYAVLLQRISEGEYPVGSALPSESRLSEEFAVSKATIRKAVDEMVVRGYVVRRQGSGTYVSARGLRPEGGVFVGSMDDLISGTPHLPVHDVRVSRGVRFPQDVREVFSPGVESGTIVRSRRKSGDTIFVYSVHYLSPGIEPLITEEELREGGMMALLRRRGVPLTAVEQTMSARLADVEVAEEFDIGVGSPVLLARRVLHAQEGPVDVTRIWYRGDMFQWRASLRLAEGQEDGIYSASAR